MKYSLGAPCDLCQKDLNIVFNAMNLNYFGSCALCNYVIILSQFNYFLNKSLSIRHNPKSIFQVNGVTYSSSEWDRVLKMKAFL